MPALPNVNKVLRTALRHSFNEGDTDVIVRYFTQYSGTAPSDGDLDTFCSTLVGVWETDIEPLCTSAVTLIGVTCEDLTSATAAVGSTTSAGVGTRSGGVLGAGTAGVISLLIPRRYRGGHPRNYWPVGSDTDLADRSQWTSGFLTAFLDGVVAYFAGVAASGWSGAGTLEGVNVSYFEGFTPHEYPSGRYRNIPNLRVTPVVDVVSGYRVNPQLCSQRRRNQSG